MKRLTPACRLVLFSLWHKRDYFSRKSMLEKDGSFYYDDKRLSEETGLSGKTILRVRRFLVGNGYIIVEIGHFKGKATKYWVCKKPDRKSPFSPLSKVDNQFPKAPQNVPINKVNNKDNNNRDLIKDKPLETFTKEGVRSLVNVQGVEWVRGFCLGMEWMRQRWLDY